MCGHLSEGASFFNEGDKRARNIPSILIAMWAEQKNTAFAMDLIYDKSAVLT